MTNKEIEGSSSFPTQEAAAAKAARPLELSEMSADDEAVDWVTSNLMAVRRDNGMMEYTLAAVVRAYQAGKEAGVIAQSTVNTSDSDGVETDHVLPVQPTLDLVKRAFDTGFAWRAQLIGYNVEDSRAVGRTLYSYLFDDMPIDMSGFNSSESADSGIVACKKLIVQALRKMALELAPHPHSTTEFEQLASEIDMNWVEGLFGTEYGSGAEFLADVARRLDKTPTVRVKRLKWEALGEGYYRAKAPLFGNIRVEKYGDSYQVCWSVPGFMDTLVPGEFDSAAAAMDAAQERYDLHILSVIEVTRPHEVGLPSGMLTDIEYQRMERVCYDAAMGQWERSRKRPDLSEMDRVRSAVEAYKRQAFAFTLEPRSQTAGRSGHGTIEAETGDDLRDIAWDGQSVEALVEQYANGAYIGNLSKPSMDVCRKHFQQFVERLLPLLAGKLTEQTTSKFNADGSFELTNAPDGRATNSNTGDTINGY